MAGLTFYWDSEMLLIVTAFMSSLGKIPKCMILQLEILKCGVWRYFVVFFFWKKNSNGVCHCVSRAIARTLFECILIWVISFSPPKFCWNFRSLPFPSSIYLPSHHTSLPQQHQQIKSFSCTAWQLWIPWTFLLLNIENSFLLKYFPYNLCFKAHYCF